MKTAPARVGRPPRVTRAEIAEAALAVGLHRATVRTVAEHLGMSVPGLYHHVRSREELLALAGAHALASVGLPDDTGQPWTDWLLASARTVYDSLVAQPELVAQIRAGALDSLRQTQQLERFLAVLGGHGFTLRQAFEIYLHVMTAVTGAATSRVGRRAASEAGRPVLEEFARASDLMGSDAAHVQRLVRELKRSRRAREIDPFDTVRLVVAGIEARYGREAA
jgi:AcrR family transcriptional regulator